MKSIVQVLGELNQGRLIADADARLQEILKAVEDTGGDGSVTLKLKVSLNDDGTASVSPEISAKKPYKKRAPSTFFLENGELHKEHPRQMKLGENVHRLSGTDKEF